MEKEKFSYPVSLRRMQITDKFWKNEMELVRTEVIPYQWNALNDKVEGAAPSYCMHNFKVAAEMNRQKRKQGAAYKEPSYTYRGFEMLPEDPENLKDEFYGYGENKYSTNESKESNIEIEPSKKGTFTAAATKHGKSVQGFANQVLKNKDNYSPAMVKKANFAKNFGVKKK